MTRLINIFFSLLFFLGSISLKAQELIEIPPIFEYPVAPEELETLEAKSDYLVAHFWDQLDTKSTKPLNQTALNDAFRVYLTPIRFVEEKKALQSINKLITGISGNPTLLIQFTKAAEENLYGPRAEIWADEIYLKFLDAAIKNKKISKVRKEKYQKRADLLRSTEIGKEAPSFSFETKDGKIENYFPMSTPTIIIFGDPEDMDWRLERLRMDSNTIVTQALDKGKLNVLFIDITENPDWEQSVSNYSGKWKVGKSTDMKDIYDIRIVPCVYFIDNEGNIAIKNRKLEHALPKVLEIAGW